MKLIPLTQGKFAQIDDEDYDRISKWKWYALKHGTVWYAKRCSAKYEGRNFSPVYMHREIMGCKKGDKKVIDHKDRNGLNCQKNNLRFCNQSQNISNRTSRVGSSSKYLGVYFDKRNKTWVAQTKVNRKSTYLGSSKNEDDAAKIYDKTAAALYGEFANLNFK